MAKDIKPILTGEDYRNAQAEIDRLWGSKLGTPNGDRLSVLATLVHAYGAKQFPIARPNPIAAIEFRMEQQGLERRDLQVALGRRGRVSEVLSGKRPLTLGMIRRLSALLDLPADILIEARPASLVSAAPAPDTAKMAGKILGGASKASAVGRSVAASALTARQHGRHPAKPKVKKAS